MSHFHTFFLYIKLFIVNSTSVSLSSGIDKVIVTESKVIPRKVMVHVGLSSLL